VAALITVTATCIISVGLYIAAYKQQESSKLWMDNAERALAIMLAALAYLFGKGGK
jgi:hypothetical protein